MMNLEVSPLYPLPLHLPRAATVAPTSPVVCAETVSLAPETRGGHCAPTSLRHGAVAAVMLLPAVWCRGRSHPPNPRAPVSTARVARVATRVCGNLGFKVGDIKEPPSLHSSLLNQTE